MGLDTGGAPSTARDDSIGQGLRNLGNAVGQAGSAMADVEMRRLKMAQATEDFKVEQEWQRTKLGIAAQYDQAKLNVDPSGAGFTEAANKIFIDQYDEFLKTVPERLRPQFAEVVATDKEGRLLQAAADEVAQRNAWFEVGVSDTVNAAQTDVAAAPGMFDAKLADVNRIIDATGLPPAKKLDLKRNAEAMLGRAWFESQMRNDPGFAKTMLGVGVGSDADTASLLRSEEGIRTSAYWDVTAYRVGYGSDTVTRADGTVEKVTASTVITPADAERDLARRIKEFETTAAGQVGPQLWGDLPGNVQSALTSVAYNYGSLPGSVVTAAKSGNVSAIAAAVERLPANPERRAREAALIRGGAEAAPQVANLPFNERVQLFDQAVAAEKALVTAQAAEAKAAYDAEKDRLSLAIELGEVASRQSILDAALDDGDKALLLSKWNTQQEAQAKAEQMLADLEAKGVYDTEKGRLELAIETGELTSSDAILNSEILKDDDKAALLSKFESQQNQVETERAKAGTTEKGRLELGIQLGQVTSAQDILANPALTDADKASLISKLETKQAKYADAKLLLDALSRGTGATVNPYDADQRKIANDAFDLMRKSLPDEQRLAAEAAFVAQTGVVPDPVIAEVRQSLNSLDPVVVASGLERAATLNDAAPNGLNVVENGKELRDAASAYDHYVNDRGMTLEQATTRYMESKDPKAREKADVLTKRWTDESKKLTVDDVRRSFDETWVMGGEPSLGMMPFQQDAMAADYMTLAEEAFVGDANGDVELARKMALAEMKRVYGVSKVSGQDVLTKFPPENFYPPLDGGQTYIRDFALKDARTLDPAASNVMLVPARETAQDVRAGLSPRYNLMYLNADGVWDMAPDLFAVGAADMQALAAIESETKRITLEVSNDYNRAFQSGFVAPGTPSDVNPLAGGNLPGPQDVVPNYGMQQQRLVRLDEQRKALLGQTTMSAPNIDPQLAESLQQFRAGQ